MEEESKMKEAAHPTLSISTLLGFCILLDVETVLQNNPQTRIYFTDVFGAMHMRDMTLSILKRFTCFVYHLLKWQSSSSGERGFVAALLFCSSRAVVEQI
jgi:hypothetical protein